jgi:hypothetical protein
MILTKANAFQYALCMDLQSNFFSYSVIDINTKKSIDYKSIELSDYSKAELVKCIEDDFFKWDFKSVSLTVSTNRHTLVPTSIFGDSDAKSIFSLNHQKPFDNIDYNRIPELGIVSIYEIPMWIRSAFVLKIPRIKIVHTSIALLKGLFNQPVFNSKLSIYMQKDSFYLAITSKSKLQYFNLFQSNQIPDLVYNVLFVLEQKELAIKDMSINLYGVLSTWDKKDELSKLLNQAVNVDSLAEKSGQFILTNQLLCV